MGCVWWGSCGLRSKGRQHSGGWRLGLGESWGFLGSLLSFAFGVRGLEHTGGRHQVLNVLTQNLVL